MLATLEEIKEFRGKLYHPQVVDVCLKLFVEDGFSFKEEDQEESEGNKKIGVEQDTF